VIDWCPTDYAVLTELPVVHNDENTHSTPADDATDVNSCRMELFFYFLL